MKRSMWRKFYERAWWQRYLAYLGVVIGLVIVSWVAVDQWAKARWRAWEREVVASGESLDPDFYRAKMKPGIWDDPEMKAIIEGEPDFSMKVILLSGIDESDSFEASKKRSELHDRWQVSAARHLELYFPAEALESQAAAAKLLGAFPPEVTKALEWSSSRFLEIPGSSILSADDPEARILRGHTQYGFATLLELRAIGQIQMGYADKALSDIQAIQSLAKHTFFGGFYSDFINGSYVTKTAYQPIWEGLNSRVWDSKQLSTLDRSLTDFFDSIEPLENLTARSAAHDAQFLQRYLKTHLMLKGRWALPDSGRRLVDFPKVLPDAEWLEAANLSLNRFLLTATPRSVFAVGTIEDYEVIHTVLLDRTRSVSDRIQACDAIYTILQNRNWRFPQHLMFANNYSWILEKRAELTAYTAIIRTAIAAERHFLDRSEYPVNFSDLCPTYLPTVPEDPWNVGHPIIYKIGSDDRPVIYSIGQNGIDNGGTPRRYPTDGDLVWRYSLPLGYDPEIDYR